MTPPIALGRIERAFFINQIPYISLQRRQPDCCYSRGDHKDFRRVLLTESQIAVCLKISTLSYLVVVTLFTKKGQGDLHALPKTTSGES